jgi:hypothetical protein
MAVAKGWRKQRTHKSNFSISPQPQKASPDEIAQQLYPRLLPVYRYYGKKPSFDRFRQLVNKAWQATVSFQTKRL